MAKKPKISTSPKSMITSTNISSINTQLVVSYKYLCDNNKKYNIDSLGDNKKKLQFLCDYYEKMKEYGDYANFKAHINSDKRYRLLNHIHPIDWKDNRIRESCFNCLDSNLMEQIKKDCWQLGINRETFRIHGFFIENVFYVVWLDPNHELYERK